MGDEGGYSIHWLMHSAVFSVPRHLHTTLEVPHVPNLPSLVLSLLPGASGSLLSCGTPPTTTSLEQASVRGGGYGRETVVR